MKPITFALRSVVLAACAVLTACGAAPEPTGEATTAAAHGASAAEFERGPHRGRLLRAGAFALELQIFEDGVPPEYHVYLFRDGKPLPPTAATASVQLTRLDGEINRFKFAQQGEFLRGDGVVTEPHSFSVVVEAVEGATTHRWTFDSFEGRTSIAAATAQAAGVQVEAAGPATIVDVLPLTGRLVANAERVREVSARFAGPVRSVARSVGDVVRAGEVLATVESNESLQTYSVTAPIAGQVVERHTNVGETAGSEPLFVIADYGALWAELALFPRDLPRVRVGQTVSVRAADGEAQGTGRIVRIAPADARGAVTGLYVARVALDNRDGRWAPGLFVQAQVHVGAVQVPLAVKRTGLQGFRDFTVVFERIGETYEVRMLELGRQDDTWVEVTGGLKPGAQYVAENSYLIKADIEKSGASHDH
jgi:membrane fusion protein, heavy metal efflux system